MKTRVLILILTGFWVGLQFCNAQNKPPVAVNDTVHIVAGSDVYVNVLKNDYDPDGDSIYIGAIAGGKVLSDSIVHIPFDYYNAGQYYNEYVRFLYAVSDTSPFHISFDTAYIYVYFDDVRFYDSLSINNVNAQFNCFGLHFWDLGESQKYFVPNGGTNTSLFSNTLWIGGIDDSSKLHLAGERYRQVGADYFQGPVSNSYDSVYDAKWFRIWKLNKAEVDYHKSHWMDSGYHPIENIASWPGNGDVKLGQSKIIAPFHDYDGNEIYDPMAGDWPDIKGNQALFFVFNDDRIEHTESKGTPLGVEIRAMAYAFDEPSDSALWHTVFLHYEIENRSNASYNECYIGSFTDIDLGYAWDDYIGCNVEQGFYYSYNGTPVDGNGEPNAYGENPPAQAVLFLGGPYLEADGFDNPSFQGDSISGPSFGGNCNIINYNESEINMEYYEPLSDTAGLVNVTANFLVRSEAINGVNFGNGIVDDERLGMNNFVYFKNGNDITSDPDIATEYYNYLRGIWKDFSSMQYGGNAHTSTSGVVGPECNFMFPGDSDPCNWGTNGIPPGGGYNQDGLYWTEEEVNNSPGDRRGLGISGPFTFNPGDVHNLDLAFVWARDYNGTSTDAIELLEDYCASVKEKFVKNEFPINIKNRYWKYNNHLLCYPNPVNDKLTLILNNHITKGGVEIFNMNGKKLSEMKISDTSEIVINTSHYKKGLYIVKIFDGNENYSTKFIKK